ncbi:hypothetical protein SALBM311S_05189 [Streptomyces alboniger]
MSRIAPVLNTQAMLTHQPHAHDTNEELRTVGVTTEARPETTRSGPSRREPSSPGSSQQAGRAARTTPPPPDTHGIRPGPPSDTSAAHPATFTVAVAPETRNRAFQHAGTRGLRNQRGRAHGLQDRSPRRGSPRDTDPAGLLGGARQGAGAEPRWGQRPGGGRGAAPLRSRGQNPAGSRCAVSAGIQRRGPCAVQAAEPAGVQGRSPAGVQGRSPAGVQGRSPAGVQGRSPAGVQGRSPAGVQGRSPAGVQAQPRRGPGAKPRRGPGAQPRWGSRGAAPGDGTVGAAGARTPAT